MSDPLWDLLQRAKESQLSSLGTTGLAVSITGALWLSRALIKLRREIKRKGWREVRKDWKSAAKEGAIGVGLTAVVWCALFAWNLHKVVVSDYGELHSLKSEIPTVKHERDEYRKQADGIPSLQQQIDSLRAQLGQKPKLVTQTVEKQVPQEVKKQCWMAPHFGMPNSAIKGAVTATAVILHCNYRVDAPLRVAIEFDRDFIPGAIVMPSSGVMMGIGTGKEGKVYLAQIGSPALPSEQVIIATVYGETDQYPRPIRAKIETVQ